MGFSGRGRSCSTVMKAPSSSTKKIKTTKNTPNQRKDERCVSKSPGLENDQSRKLHTSPKSPVSAAVFPQSFVELEVEDGMWLSSDSSSISSFFEGNRSLGLFQLFDDLWLLSRLSVSAYACMFLSQGTILLDGSVIMNRVENNLKEERTVNWLLRSTEDVSEESLSRSESFKSCCGQCFDEDSAICDSREIDTEIDSDEHNKYFLSDMTSPSPSPCFRSYTSCSSLSLLENDSMSYYDYLSSSASASASGDANVGTDQSRGEPLFWPFEGESDWSCGEAWDGFCMSPPKGSSNKQRWSGLCRRRLVFNSESKTSEIVLERSNKNGAKRFIRKSSVKVVPYRAQNHYMKDT